MQSEPTMRVTFSREPDGGESWIGVLSVERLEPCASSGSGSKNIYRFGGVYAGKQIPLLCDARADWRTYAFFLFCALNKDRIIDPSELQSINHWHQLRPGSLDTNVTSRANSKGAHQIKLVNRVHGKGLKFCDAVVNIDQEDILFFLNWLKGKSKMFNESINASSQFDQESVLQNHPKRAKAEIEINLLSQCQDTGLINTWRRHKKGVTTHPPERFFASAKTEVVITGLSTYLTFYSCGDSIEEALDRGKKIYVAMMHPQSPQRHQREEIEGIPFEQDIRRAIKIIDDRGFYRRQNFHVRFFMEMPSFTAIMVDGNLVPNGDSIFTETSQIIVQTFLNYRPQTEGIVRHYRYQGEGKDWSGFENYARDLRLIWQHRAREYPDLFAVSRQSNREKTVNAEGMDIEFDNHV